MKSGCFQSMTIRAASPRCAGIRAEELHAERALGLDEFEILQRPLVAPENTLGGDELRDHHIRAVFLGELAKNGVRHPGHRREVKRETGLGTREALAEGALARIGQGVMARLRCVPWDQCDP